MFHPQWEEVLVEVLNGKGISSISNDQLLISSSLRELFSEKKVVMSLIKENLA